MNDTQLIQEEEYTFPYHHIPEIKPFSQTRSLWWGYEYTAYLEQILLELSAISFESFIDIGCGDGRLLSELSKTSTVELSGTDFSDKALAFAHAFAPARVTFTNKIPERTFDAFAAIEVFEHIPPSEADAFLESVANALNANAMGVLSVPTTNVLLNPKHYRHFTEDTLRTALSKHFIVERVIHLNAQTLSAKLIQRMLANRFFILNWEPGKNALYSWYKKSCLLANEQNAMRLLAVIRKR